MRYFNTALAFGSIARAAEHLNIAASAVSAAIDQVEETFELTLITRQRSRGITANASGRLVAQKFERLLEDYQSILLDGAELKQSLSGVLRVGYYAPVAPAFLPEIFSTFLPKDGNVVLHLQECDNDRAQDGLMNGDFDVILFVSDGAKATIDFDILIEAAPYCLLPASHPLTEQKSVSMAQIAEQSLVILDRPIVATYYQKLLQDFVATPKIAAFANSSEMVRSLVSQGLGCAVLNMKPLTEVSYTAEMLAFRPISDRLRPLTLSIAYDHSRPRRIVDQFVQTTRKYFAENQNKHCVALS
jgi:DNA-binding transcriptional LysR family regulator